MYLKGELHFISFRVILKTDFITQDTLGEKGERGVMMSDFVAGSFLYSLKDVWMELTDLLHHF